MRAIASIASMVIDDLDQLGAAVAPDEAAAVAPDEANAPLIVYPYRVLAPTAARQSIQSIARR
jgi:hypothetical protein